MQPEQQEKFVTQEFFKGNMPANPVVCPSGPMNGSPFAEELNTFTGITKNYEAYKIGVTQKKLSTFPADSSHVRALTNISTKNQKITAPK